MSQTASDTWQPRHEPDPQIWAHWTELECGDIIIETVGEAWVRSDTTMEIKE